MICESKQCVCLSFFFSLSSLCVLSSVCVAKTAEQSGEAALAES